MSPQRVLLTDRAWPNTDIERATLAADGIELVEADATDEATLARLAVDCVAIATNWAKVTPAVVAAAKHLKTIARTGIGIDNIAVDAATARKIPVTNVPDYCVEEVADHTLGLLLACARRLAFFHGRTKRGEYDLSAATPMHRLSGRTLGLVGLGRIGQAVAHRARAFGLRVLAHTRSGRDPVKQCKMVDLPHLLNASDYVSLHAPLTPETKHMFSSAEFARMKPTAYLINTSRGGLVDSAALWVALEQGQIAGAALDVFDPEPPDLTQPLYLDERIIVTPHAAFVSEESLATLRCQAMEQILLVLRGERPNNVINPQIYD